MILNADILQEITNTIRRNKLRTLLTSFSVFWGIFMLILLLGSGNGIENGVKHKFKDYAVNTVWVMSGQTSKTYKGLKIGRRLRFTNRDYESIKERVDGIEHITAHFYLGDNLVNNNLEKKIILAQSFPM